MVSIWFNSIPQNPRKRNSTVSRCKLVSIRTTVGRKPSPSSTNQKPHSKCSSHSDWYLAVIGAKVKQVQRRCKHHPYSCQKCVHSLTLEDVAAAMSTIKIASPQHHSIGYLNQNPSEGAPSTCSRNSTISLHFHRQRQLHTQSWMPKAKMQTTEITVAFSKMSKHQPLSTSLT